MNNKVIHLIKYITKLMNSNASKFHNDNMQYKCKYFFINTVIKINKIYPFPKT